MSLVNGQQPTLETQEALAAQRCRADLQRGGHRRRVLRARVRRARGPQLRARADRRRLDRCVAGDARAARGKRPTGARGVPVAQLRASDRAHGWARPRAGRCRGDARRRPAGPARADPADARSLARRAATSSTRSARSARASRGSSSPPRAGSTRCSTSSPRSSSSTTRATSGCSTGARSNALLSMRERNRFLRGMTVWVGYTQAAVPYKRDPRYAGETKYTVSKMMKFSLDAISSFSHRPLQLATLLGFLISTLAFVAIPVVIVLRILGLLPARVRRDHDHRAPARRHPADHDRDHRRVRRPDLRRGQGPAAVPGPLAAELQPGRARGLRPADADPVGDRSARVATRR